MYGLLQVFISFRPHLVRKPPAGHAKVGHDDERDERSGWAFEEVYKSISESKSSYLLVQCWPLQSSHSGYIRPPKRAVLEELQSASFVCTTSTQQRCATERTRPDFTPLYSVSDPSTSSSTGLDIIPDCPVKLLLQKCHLHHHVLGLLDRQC